MNTKTTLLNSAEDLVRSRGFDGFSYSDLATQVGIRKASIHHHYKTKADLSLALITRYRGVFMERLAEISAQEPRASGRLLSFLDLYRDAMRGGRSLCLCVAFSVTQTALPKDSTAQLEGFHADVAQWLETVFRLALHDGTLRGVTTPRAEAHAALATVEGAQIMARAAEDATRFEAAIDTLRARAI
ncbi:TetR/AcrR family transcriptional regulator [uncultured Tateyamaria sp.]|uniref:TetR/AcrR family transcriptional regulator n=1 Tax=uncultured Tateyamaria sp. TaxID=455651 RepID=UPI002601999C|nr:TetR/AcrR family transcriptional regulator [uncultured Tateyamaria sp.]